MVINEIVQHNSSHPNIIKVKENFGNSKNIGKFQNNNGATPKILKLFKNIDYKEAVGTDKTPPKLVESSKTVLSEPLRDAIINSISKGVFSDNANIAYVSLVDKQSNDKNKVSNFRAVSVLNISPT